MTRKQRRLTIIGFCLATLGVAVGLVMFAMRDTIVFFYSPSDIAEKGVEQGQRFRLGGLVEEGTVKRGESTIIRFAITDRGKSTPVVYNGVLPDLFREGQGVVTEGRLDDTGTFVADSVLAKHDENYMPPEVADALKKRGVWKDGEGKAAGEGANATETKTQ